MKAVKENKKMRELIRKIFLSVLILFFLGLTIGVPEAKNATETVPVKVIFDDETVIEGIKIVLIEKFGFISVDDISKMFNTTTTWQSVSEKVSISLGIDTVEFKVNSREVVINNKATKMGKPTKLIEGTVMVPLEFLLTETFRNFIAGRLNWDYEKRILTVTRDYNIAEIRVHTHPKYTRIVFDIRTELKYSIAKGYPDKLVVTIYHGILKNKDYSVKVNDGRIKDIVAEQNKRDVQLTIGLGGLFEDYKDFDLANPYRIVIDIRGEEVRPAQEISILPIKKTETLAKEEGNPTETVKETPAFKTEVPGALASGKSAGTKEPSSKSASSGVKIKTIVIDAGHGGKDPGAIGRRGTKEKDIVLDIAKRLARMLEDIPDVKVILTRKSDYFLPLDERTSIANSNKADLFISIHANASLSRKFEGFEIYFLSERASDKEAEAVANIENSVINLETDRPKDNLSIILWSMTLNEFMNASSELCSNIAKEVPGNVEIECRGVKQAGFYVLRDAKMPSVLVEVGFLTNPYEELKLKSRTFREKLAKAIFKGLVEYKKAVEK